MYWSICLLLSRSYHSNSLRLHYSEALLKYLLSWKITFKRFTVKRYFCKNISNLLQLDRATLSRSHASMSEHGKPKLEKHHTLPWTGMETLETRVETTLLLLHQRDIHFPAKPAMHRRSAGCGSRDWSAQLPRISYYAFLFNFRACAPIGEIKQIISWMGTFVGAPLPDSWGKKCHWSDLHQFSHGNMTVKGAPLCNLHKQA